MIVVYMTSYLNAFENAWAEMQVGQSLAAKHDCGG